MNKDSCPGCGGDAGYNWFDRTLCACDRMHTRCDECGYPLDGCPFEEALAERIVNAWFRAAMFGVAVTP